MKIRTTAAALCLALSTTTLAASALAQSGSDGATSPGRELAITAFKALDESGRGYVDTGQVIAYGGDVFVSMDANDDDKVSLDEFLIWDFGMQLIAEEQDAIEAYEAALRVVHAFWDRNGDGNLTRAEHRQALVVDFQRADVNNDAVLDQGEFLAGFTVNIAIRAALAPHIR